jgi:hypothetical protein
MSPLVLSEHGPGWAHLHSRRWGTLLVVVGLHLALLLAWRLALRPQVLVAVAPPPAGLLWLQPERPLHLPPSTATARPGPGRPPAARQVPPEPAPPSRQAASRTRPNPPAEGTRATPATPGSPVPAEAAVATTVAPAAEPPASAPPPVPGSLMDSEATRQAIRQAARQPLLSERAATATGEPFRTADGRLAEAAAQAGKGDCLKGEYFGGGAGLLSLPFLAAAVVRGQCAK